MINEVGVPIYDYPEYRITRTGEVIGKHGKPLKGHIDRCGYKEVLFCYYPHFQKWMLVHRLVLSTFSPINDMEQFDVNHINGDKLDNRLENLEWCTRSENIQHSYKNGLQRKVTNPHGTYKVLNEDDFSVIRDMHYQGYCDREIAAEIECSRSLVSSKIRKWGIRNDKD